MHRSALLRFRVLAYIVGVLLLVLSVGTILKYAADNDTIVAAIGPAHGFLYMGYLIVTADLARRVGWSLRYTVLVMLAGTVPALSFVAERAVTRKLRSVEVHQADAVPAEPSAR
jgi:integral membrane protein